MLRPRWRRWASKSKKGCGATAEVGWSSDEGGLRRRRTRSCGAEMKQTESRAMSILVATVEIELYPEQPLYGD